MSDNVAAKSDASTTVATIAADDISGVHYPRSKITIGADGVNDGDVSSSNPLPVTGTITAVTNVATIGTSITPGTSAAHLGKAEDAAHSTGDTGVMSLAVRKDTATALAGTDGDYIPLIVDSTGRLHANVSNTVTVDGSGVTQPISAVALPLPSGAAMAAKQPALGTAGTASSDVITVQGVASMTPLQVADNGGTLSIDDGGGAITVDGTVTANAGTGPFPVSDNSSSLTVDAPVGTPVFVRLSDGSSAITALPITDNAGSLTVDGTVAATQSGTWNIADVSGTVSLPTGAATAAKQPALGTAGSASSDVITVQGISGGVVIPISDGGGSLTVDGTVTATIGASVTEDAAASGGETSILIAGVRNDNGSSKTSADGDFGNISLDSAGRVGIADLGGTISIDDGSGSITVDNAGTFAVQAAQSGTWSVSQGTATNLKTQAEQYVGGTAVSNANPVPVSDAGGTLSIDDGGGSITVDGTVAVTGAGTQYTEDDPSSGGEKLMLAGAIRRDTAAVGSGADGDYSTLNVNSEGKLWAIADITNVHTADFDTGAGTDTTPAFGIAVPASGGAAVIPGSATDGLTVNLGTNNDVTLATLPDTSGGDLATINIATTTVAGAVSGTEMQVDVVGSLPAGTNAIGKLAANSGVDIGDVDVTSIVPGTGASNLGKAEDAAHSSGDVGVAAMTVRQDTAAALAGTDADYQPLITDSSGRLHVNVGNTVTVGSHAVTNAGTFAVQVDGSALAALQLIDDPVIADDAAFTPATSKVMMAGFEFDDSTPDSVDEGDAGAARMSSRREIYTQIRDAAGNERGLNIDASGKIAVTTALDATVGGSELQVDIVGALPAGTNAIGKLVANSGVDIGDVDILSIAAGDNNIGNVDIVTVPAPLSTTGGGTEATALRVTVASDSTGVLSVDDNGSSLTVDNGGTFAVQESGTQVVVDDAAYTAATNKVAVVGGIVTSDSVDSGDAGAFAMLANRQQKVTLYDSSGVELAVGGGTQYTEDAAAAANPVGNVHILVRADTPAGVTSADGDNVAQRGTDYGAAYVTLLDSSGNEVAVGGGTQYTEDAAAAANPVGNALIMVRDDALSGSLTSADGDNVAVRGNNKGELYVKHTDAIPVTDNSGSLTVDNAGTFAVQAAQSGTWTVQPGNTANTTPWLANHQDPAATTGSITAADVDSTSTSNSISQTVVTGSATANSTVSCAISGHDSIAVQISGTASLTVQFERSIDGGTTWTTIAIEQLDDVYAASMAVSDNKAYFLRAVCGGLTNFRIRCTAYTSGTLSVKMQPSFGVSHVQIRGAALTSLQLIDDSVVADDAAFTPGSTKVIVSGFEADESSTDSVDEGDAGAARMTLDRKQIVTIQPHANGGWSTFRSLDLDETEEDIKTSAGKLGGWYIFNASTSIRYVKFYNDTAANVSVGTTTPKLTIPIPAASSGGVGYSFESNIGIEFDTAICAAATTGLADADTGAPSANDVIINAWYK